MRSSAIHPETSQTEGRIAGTPGIHDGKTECLLSLADALESSAFGDEFVPAYIQDTGFTWKDVVAREIHVPAQLLRTFVRHVRRPLDRSPLGSVLVLMPKNSLGLTLAKAIAAAYLAGNQLVVYFPRLLACTAPIYARLLREHLGSALSTVHGISSARFMRESLANAPCQAPRAWWGL